jgi:hypothetical protein
VGLGAGACSFLQEASQTSDDSPKMRYFLINREMNMN